jgi:hypothetical protein
MANIGGIIGISLAGAAAIAAIVWKRQQVVAYLDPRIHRRGTRREDDRNRKTLTNKYNKTSDDGNEEDDEVFRHSSESPKSNDRESLIAKGKGKRKRTRRRKSYK